MVLVRVYRVDGVSILEVTSEPGTVHSFFAGDASRSPAPPRVGEFLCAAGAVQAGWACLEVHIVSCCVPQLVSGSRLARSVHVGWTTECNLHTSARRGEGFSTA